MANNIFTGALSNNWAVAGNWSLGSIPTATDGHVAVFDGSSPDCDLGAGNRVCNALMMSAYTGTLSFGTRSLTVSGDLTLGSGITLTGTGTLAANNGGNITTNGYVIPFGFQFAGTNKTYTLQDDLSCYVNLSLNGTTSLFINNNGTPKTMYVYNNVSSSAGGCQGTAKIKMIGTGQVATTAAIRNDFEFDASGNTITIGASFRYAGGTLKYISGTIDTTTNNSTLFLGLGAVTTTQVETSAITWNNISVQTSNTTTLNEDLVCGNNYVNSGTFTLNGPGSLRMTSNSGGTFTLGGSATMQGTAKVIFEGSNVEWVGSTGTLQCDVDINTSGTLTLTNNCSWRIATMTHISGSVIGTGQIYTTSTATWDIGSGSLPAVAITTSVQTLNSTFNVGTLTLGLSSTVTFAGSFGFNVDNLIHTTTNRAITLKAGNTYTVNQSLLLRGSGSPSSSTNSVTLQSNTTFGYAYFNVATGATSNCMWVRAIDIDSSGGRELYTSNGLVSRSLNWVRTNPNAYLYFDNQ